MAVLTKSLLVLNSYFIINVHISGSFLNFNFYSNELEYRRALKHILTRSHFRPQSSISDSQLELLEKAILMDNATTPLPTRLLRITIFCPVDNTTIYFPVTNDK